MGCYTTSNEAIQCNRYVVSQTIQIYARFPVCCVYMLHNYSLTTIVFCGAKDLNA